MAERTIRSGIGTYQRPDGVWTHGMFGDVVDVHEDDVARFDRLNPAPLDEEILEAEVVEIELPKATNSHDEIDAFAAEYSIDLSGLGDKPNRETKVAEIERVIAERTAEAEASGVLQ